MQNFQPYEAYLKIEMGRSPSTIRAYVLDLKRFFKKTPIKSDEVTTKDLREFLGQFSDLSPRYYHRTLSSLSKYFDFLKNVEKSILSNPCDDIGKPKIPKRNPPSLSIDQVRKLISVASDKSRYSLSTRNWTLLTLLYFTGLRVSEICNLLISGISYKDGLPHFLKVIGKGDKERSVVLTDEASRALNLWLEHRRKTMASLPPHERSDRVYDVTPRIVQNICKKYGNMSGIKNCHPHLLRHTYATEAARNGAQLHALRDSLGHANIATTGIYLHANKTDLEQLAECLPSATE